MSYEIQKQVKAALEKAVDDAAAALAKWDQFKGPMGLTPDHIKANMDWRNDKNAFDVAFQTLRNFNAKFNRTYKKEINAERRERMNNHFNNSPFKI